MKHLIVLISGSLILASCTDQSLDPDRYPQRWELVKMTGSMVNSETTGEEMPWQEYYVLRADRTFLKSRTRNGEVTEAEGRYTLEDTPDGKRLVLSYPVEPNIIGNCTAEPEEHLYFRTPNHLVNDWAMCDGPGMDYTRVE